MLHVVQSLSWRVTLGLVRKTITYVQIFSCVSVFLTLRMELVVITVKDYLNKMLRTGANSTAPSIPTIPVPVPRRQSKVGDLSVYSGICSMFVKEWLQEPELPRRPDSLYEQHQEEN
jgi:hypothetical protein